MTKGTYSQCRLEKGNYWQVAWIPTEYAIKDKVLKIKENGIWEDGWIVATVGEPMSEKYIVGHERDYTKQRQFSDIHLGGIPKLFEETK